MTEKKYSDLNDLNEKSKSKLKSDLEKVVDELKDTDFIKFRNLINNTLESLKISYESEQHQKQRPKLGKQKGQHPIKPIRGEIYNALLGEKSGSELSGQHPVIVIQNDAGNLYAQKVIVIPIEGDGNKIDESYMMKVNSEDLEGTNKLTKEPSRLIISEIMTIDKARLGIKVGKLKKEKIKELNQKVYNQISLDKPL